MIHPTAIISPESTIHSSVKIGAYAQVEGKADLAEGCRIGAGAQIIGDVRIGVGTQIGRGAIIGDTPQDFSFAPETESGVKIGKNNTVREHVTIHRSAQPGGMTEVGDDNFIMVGAHLGHDVRVGDGNVIANACLLAGHVTLGNRAFLGGGAVFHQFLRIGNLAIIQGNGRFSRDVPPYCTGSGLNQIVGLNAIGLRRAGFPPEVRKGIRTLYDLLFRSGKNLSQAVKAAQGTRWDPEAAELLHFVTAESSKGICTHGREG